MEFFINEGYTVGNACELLPIFGKDGVNNSIKAKEIIKNNFDSSYTQAEIRTILQSMTFKDNSLIIVEKGIEQVREEKAAVKAEKKAEKAKKLEEKKSGNSNKPKVEKTANTGKSEPTYDYTLPWLDKGDLIDNNVTLTEADAKEVAKVLMKILEKI